MEKLLTVFLAGNSKKNLPWIARIQSAMDLKGPTFVQKYDHWNKDQGHISFDRELDKLNAQIPPDGEYDIVSKSAGAVLALMAINKHMAHPRKLVCIGMPIIFARNHDIDLEALVASNHIQTLYIQASSDPMGNVDEIKKLLSGKNHLQIVPGQDHDYGDIDKITKLAKDLLGSS